MAKKVLSTFDENVANVSLLADRPTETAAALKAVFDAAGGEIQTDGNILIAELQASTLDDSGAHGIGLGIAELSADNVADGLKEIIAESGVSDSANVKLSGNQTISGVKTFNSSPIVPTPTTDMQASPKKYVDDLLTDMVAGQFPPFIASSLPVTDSGSYFTGENLESVTQEIGSQLAQIAHSPSNWSELKTIALSLQNGETIRLKKGITYIADDTVTINKINIEIDGNGAKIISQTTNPVFKFSLKPSSCDNSKIHSLDFENGENRSRNPHILVEYGLGMKVYDIRADNKSYGRPIIHFVDCYNSRIENITAHALGNVPAIIITAETLNVSTINIKNVFATMGMAVFVGGVRGNFVSNLLETVTLENIHYLLGTTNTPKTAENSLASNVLSGDTTFSVNDATGFELGMPIILGSESKAEWNLIKSINGNVLEMHYPLIADNAQNSRILGGNIGISVTGVSTYSIKIDTPHLENVAIGIDIHGARCVDVINPFITGQITTYTKGIYISLGRYINLKNCVFYNMDYGVFISNKISGSWGAASGYISVDGYSPIGTLSVALQNNSGIELTEMKNSSGHKTYGGNSIFKGSISVGGGSTLNKIIRSYTGLAFGTISAQSQSNQSFTVSGASVGDIVTFSPVEVIPGGVVWQAQVIAANTVRVSMYNISTASVVVGTITGSAEVRKY